MTLIVLCFLMVISRILLDDYFYRTRPREPESESGRIHPQMIHGGVLVYLTRTEKFPFEYFPALFVAFAVTAYVLNRRWRCIARE